MTNTPTQLGKYQLLELLGKGGMAEVYRARQPMLERDVAIKILHHHLASSDDFVARFQREARSLGQLRHPHIVSVIDFAIEEASNLADDGQSHVTGPDGKETNIYYMVMDFIPGPTLAELLQQKGKLPVGDSLRITEQIASSLSYAHEHGMIHRDIKPANVMFLDEEHQHAMLTDFGIARLLEEASMTVAGTIIGTPMYMSPEAGNGQPVDERADIYSLGVVLYELITGEVPYKGDTPVSIMTQHLSAPLPPIREVVPNLPEIVALTIDKAMAKDPGARFQSAASMQTALQQAQLTLNQGQMPDTVVLTNSTLMEEQTVPATIVQEPTTDSVNQGEPAGVSASSPAGSSAAAPSKKEDSSQSSGSSLPKLLIGLAAILLAVAAWYFLTQTPADTPAITEQQPSAEEAPAEEAPAEEAPAEEAPAEEAPAEEAPAEEAPVEEAPAEEAPAEEAPAEVVEAVPASTDGDGPEIGQLQIRPVDGGEEFTLALGEMEALPDGDHYHGWIRTNDNRLLDLGILSQDGSNIRQQLIAPPNTLSLIETVFVTQESVAQPTSPAEIIVATGAIAEETVTALKNFYVESDTPLGKPLLTATDAEVAVAQNHTGMLIDALADDDLTFAKQHAEHVINIVDGQNGELFGDYTGDGQAQNPGDGIGVRAYLDEIDLLLSSASVEQKQLEQATKAATAAMTVARQITAADTAAEAESLADALMEHLSELLIGADPNGSGRSETAQEEGGSETVAETVFALPVVSLRR